MPECGSYWVQADAMQGVGLPLLAYTGWSWLMTLLDQIMIGWRMMGKCPCLRDNRTSACRIAAWLASRITTEKIECLPCLTSPVYGYDLTSVSHAPNRSLMTCA